MYAVIPGKSSKIVYKSHFQDNQTSEFERDFPVDERLYGNLKKCGRYNFGGEVLANNIQPVDTQIYAEIGHLSTFCKENLTLPTLYNETFNLNEVVAGKFYNFLFSKIR